MTNAKTVDWTDLADKRIEQLETTIEEQSARIEQLEARVEWLDGEINRVSEYDEDGFKWS